MYRFVLEVLVSLWVVPPSERSRNQVPFSRRKDTKYKVFLPGGSLNLRTRAGERRMDVKEILPSFKN